MFDALIADCAVDGAPPAVIREIIRVESSGDPLTAHVNGTPSFAIETPRTAADAARLAERVIDEGLTVDLGLMQINSANYGAFDLDPITVLDPCTNIAVGSAIFMRAYRATASFYGETELALETALSAYNTGTLHRGFANGYVARYRTGRSTPAGGERASSPPPKGMSERSKEAGRARGAPTAIAISFE